MLLNGCNVLWYASPPYVSPTISLPQWIAPTALRLAEKTLKMIMKKCSFLWQLLTGKIEGGEWHIQVSIFVYQITYYKNLHSWSEQG
ncbi:hypothetical protein OKW21_001046 [Catalinimonas alkaloidigena]|nr:hypothetical protein [Catalinimonas alkaloidigena]